MKNLIKKIYIIILMWDYYNAYKCIETSIKWWQNAKLAPYF